MEARIEILEQALSKVKSEKESEIKIIKRKSESEVLEQKKRWNLTKNNSNVQVPKLQKLPTCELK